MKDLIKTAYSATNFKEDGLALIELLAKHISDSTDLKDEKTINWETPEKQLEFWQKDFESPTLSNPLSLFKSVIEKSLNLHNPKYLGHQVATTLPVTALSSMVIAYLNQGLPVYEMAMVGNALEKVVTKHLADKFGFGNEAAGIVTSGGTLANLTALLAARTNFEEKDFPNLAILVSGEAHYSIERAVKILGLSPLNVIKVPVNVQFQMRTELLEELYQEALSEGKKIMCVIGCACSTSVGAYDDLNAIGDWANGHNIWFHVDGAHGAAAIYSPTYKHLLAGIEKADSVILDFHKLLMAPSLSTALIYKNGKYASRTFAQKADYIFNTESQDDWYNSGKRTFECTKPMQILNAYTTMRLYGEELYKQHIDRLYGLAKEFAATVSNSENFDLAVDPESNIVCFRLKTEENSDEINKEIAEKLLMDGTFFIVNTVIDGEFWLRITIQNPLTTLNDLEQLLNLILEIHHQVPAAKSCLSV
ncbi:MAG TPA: aminotransferase class I/II-fold pyridoxal phosphate-dependent enzyme [Daejeonella sp.]|nr:aminotransferase class I/II-fold pyridoxal phosphate-dependent enzyme [Daejeonella sp.]